MRYTETKLNEKKPVKEPKKDIPIKAGNPGYDYTNMMTGKKIPTRDGYK